MHIDYIHFGWNGCMSPTTSFLIFPFFSSYYWELTLRSVSYNKNVYPFYKTFLHSKISKVCICSDKNVVIQRTSFYVSTFKSLDEPKEMIECS